MPELPRGLARFNRAVVNPIQGTYAWLLPPWAVVCHRGRRSGRLYRTPVLAWRRGPTIAVAVLYGERSDWVRNVLAGGASLVRAGRTYPLIEPRVVELGSAQAAGAVPAVPAVPAVRVVARLSGKVLVAELGEPAPGFGRGPVASRS